MSETALPYEVRAVPDSEALRLELWVENRRIATASAVVEVLDAMQRHLGLAREQVAQELRASLEALLKNQLDKVTISDLREEGSLRYVARYTYRDFETVATGLVWYDVQTSETGPSEIPAVVRNKLRHEVHRRLTGEGTHARAIVDLTQ